MSPIIILNIEVIGKAREGFCTMKSTKVMQLGILIMLLGIGLVLGIAQAAYNIGMPFIIIRALPVLGAIITFIGFIVGVAGFAQKD
ncbi:MAG: hypothetical protein NVSMB44_19590 [Ktedonobacteraceae bacterium]